MVEVARLVNQYFAFVAAQWCTLLTSLDCWGGREVRNEKFRDRVCDLLGRVFPSFAVFLLLSGELGIGRPCCAAQADRDLSETPPRHGRWSTTGGTSADAWGVWATDGVPSGTGAVDALRWTPTVASFPLREKVPHSSCTHPQRAHSAHTHDRARCATRHVRCHVHVSSLRRCGLVSACE